MKRFKKIYVEITNVCNLKCEFCPLTTREPEWMRVDSFEYILTQIKPLTDQVYFHLMGEPLLHPDLGTFLSMCHDHGLKVNITTNGVLIAEQMDLLIHSPAVKQVNISLSSFEANSHVLSLEQYIRNITDFALRAQAESILVVSLRLWNLDSDTLKGANQWNEAIFALLESHLNLDFKIKEKCQSYRGGNLLKNIYINQAEKFEWPDIDRDDQLETVFCYGLRDHIGILVDGTVVPCCLDSEGNIALGNLYETSLENIISSDRAQNMIKGFTNRKVTEELCKKCGYARRF